MLFTKLKVLLTLLICGVSNTFFSSCTADGNEFANHLCYFTFDTSIHNTSIIKTCVNPMSSGMFCMAWQDSWGGIRYIKAQLNDGKTCDLDNDGKGNPITTEKEARQSCIMGVSNGLIIGCSTGYQLYAFDRLCPMCYNDGFNKPLQWGSDGWHVTCPRCKRSYNLNNGGFGETEGKLMRYRASYTGAMLIVSNR